MFSYPLDSTPSYGVPVGVLP